MALAKDCFFQEELTEQQQQAVKEVEQMIDDHLAKTYKGEQVEVRVRQWELSKEDQRCKVEILRRYTAAGWRFSWYEDSRDGDLHAILS